MNTGRLFVRTYRDSDHDRVVNLWATVFPNDPPWNEPSDLISRKRSIQPDLFWVADEGGQIVGTVLAGYDGVRG